MPPSRRLRRRTCRHGPATRRGQARRRLRLGRPRPVARHRRARSVRDLETEFEAALTGIASVVDQSDSRIVVRIAGPRARDVLAKGVPIDLIPASSVPATSPSRTRATSASFSGRSDDSADLRGQRLFRSYADSFAHWLAESAAEYAASA